MKKQYILVGTMISLMCLTGCNKFSTKQSDKTPKTISYSKLKELAGNPYLEEPTNYSISGKLCNYPNNASYLKTYDSNLCAQYVGGKVSITNFITGEVIANNVKSGAFTYSSYRQTVYYSSIVVENTVPMIVYAEYDDTANADVIRYVDPYGKTIKKEYNLESRYISFRSSKKVGDETYFYFFDDTNQTLEDGAYFKYSIVDNKYVVTEVSFDDAKKVFTFNVNSEEYDDGLLEVYDNYNKTTGYFYQNNGLLNMYDEGKNYLGTVNLNAYGMGDSSLPSVIVNSKAYIFKTEEYYEKILERGSETTYRSYCLEIDFITGKVKFDDDFKYSVSGTDIHDSYNGKDEFVYTIVDFVEILEDRTLSKVQKYTIAKDKLDFSDAVIDDQWDGWSYKIDDNDIITRFAEVIYVVNKNVRKALPGISITDVYKDKTIIYKNQDGLYYTCELKDLRYNVYNLVNGKEFISGDLYNGERISYSYNLNGELVNNDNVKFSNDYLDHAKNGLYISGSEVYVGKTKVIDSQIPITSVQVTSNSGCRVVEITFADGSSQDMYFSMIELN